MKEKYWKIICSYGHVGRRNEISVARYIKTEDFYTIVDVNHLASTMPGVKKNVGCTVYEIDFITYLEGKESEKNDFYLQILMNYKCA